MERHRRIRLYERLRAGGCSEALALEAAGTPRSTLFRWRRAFRQRGLANRRRRPARAHGPRWTRRDEAAVWDLRRRFPFMGRAKVRVMLAREGAALSEATVGRILAKGVRLGRVRPCAFRRGRAKAKRRRSWCGSRVAGLFRGRLFGCGLALGVRDDNAAADPAPGAANGLREVVVWVVVDDDGGTVFVEQRRRRPARIDADAGGVELRGGGAVRRDVEVGQIPVVRSVWIAQPVLLGRRIDVPFGGLEVRRTAAGAVQVNAMPTGRHARQLDIHDDAARRLLKLRGANHLGLGVNDLGNGEIRSEHSLGQRADKERPAEGRRSSALEKVCIGHGTGPPFRFE